MIKGEVLIGRNRNREDNVNNYGRNAGRKRNNNHFS